MSDQREDIMFRKLAEAISLLACELRESREQRKTEFEWFKSHANLATKCDLKELENKIMAVLNDYLQKQKAWNDRNNAAVDGLVTSLGGVTADVKALNDKITELQNSPGGVTPADQALIDELESLGEAAVTKLEGAVAALKQLDDQTPPVVPPAPPA